MTSTEQDLLEQMALSAQLSRQLCHDYRNFLYNLVLQIDMFENGRDPEKTDWERIKKETTNLAARIQEWDAFARVRFHSDPVDVDLHHVLRGIGASWSTRPIPVRLAPAILTERLIFPGDYLEAYHLLSLLLEEGVRRWQARQPPCSQIVIHTEKAARHAIVRLAEELQDADRRRGVLEEEERETPATPSLVASACQSLAQRLGCVIHHELHADGRGAVIVEFPLHPNGGRL